MSNKESGGSGRASVVSYLLSDLEIKNIHTVLRAHIIKIIKRFDFVKIFLTVFVDVRAEVGEHVSATNLITISKSSLNTVLHLVLYA